ncbi:MAG: signal peptide peptidase SppA [Planctomycetes bacterium]|nr:signal peptide peptidase SppA [Planctomycetota bacterium]
MRVALVASLAAFLAIGVSAGPARCADDAPKPKVAHVRLSGEVGEGTISADSMRAEKDLHFIRERLAKAEADKAVRAVFLDLAGVECGFGLLDELRDAVSAVRKSGKKVVAYSSSGESRDILLGLEADEFWMPESAWMMLVGVRSEVYFYKEILDLLGVKADFLKVGDFKSAVEPYTRTSLSEPARRQMAEMLDDFFNKAIIGGILKARPAGKLTAAGVKAAIDKAPLSARDALEAGLLDRVGYRHEALERAIGFAGAGAQVVNDYEKKKAPEIDFSNPFSLLKALNPPKSKAGKDPRIAVIYAVGAIDTGKSGVGLMGSKVGSDTIVEAIRQAEDDATVKAIVLRIDSPGGSALASDLIWAELRRCKKPVIASMGDVAASGGYYIAMAARRIIAEPSTITGSIGVFGGKLAYGPVMEKAGLRTEVVSRGANAGVLSGGNPFSDSERQAMSKLIEETYGQFLAKAAEGRKNAGKAGMTVEKIKPLAGGRVWTGRQALANGLVDELGTLDQAILAARDLTDMAKDKSPELLRLPKAGSVLDSLLDFELGVGAMTNAFGQALANGTAGPGARKALSIGAGLANLKGGPVYLLPLEPMSIR